MHHTVGHGQPTQPLAVTPPDGAQPNGAANDAIPLPPGLRTVVLTEQAAEAIRDLPDDDRQPTHAGQEMFAADASALKKKAP
jgi:hypothetical protein